MKLNTKQPYGHIYGNHAATFTQHGKFFDGAGNEIDEDGLEKDESNADSVEQAQEWLKSILFETRMTKARIVKQAEVDSHSWHDVVEASNILNVHKSNSGNSEYWKLIE